MSSENVGSAKAAAKAPHGGGQLPEHAGVSEGGHAAAAPTWAARPIFSGARSTNESAASIGETLLERPALDPPS